MSLDQSSGLFRCQLSHTSLSIGGGAASVGGLYIGQLVILSAYITGVQELETSFFIATWFLV